MITHCVPGMDVSGSETRGQLCRCPSLPVMKTCLDWLSPRESLASVHILPAVAAARLSARQETPSLTFYENFDLWAFLLPRIHHFPFVLAGKEADKYVVSAQIFRFWPNTEALQVTKVYEARNIYKLQLSCKCHHVESLKLPDTTAVL